VRVVKFSQFTSACFTSNPIAISCVNIQGLGTKIAHFYLSSYLDQETAKRPFRSSSQAATCYYHSNH